MPAAVQKKNHARRDTIVTFYVCYIAAGRYNIVYVGTRPLQCEPLIYLYVLILADNDEECGNIIDNIILYFKENIPDLIIAFLMFLL